MLRSRFAIAALITVVAAATAFAQVGTNDHILNANLADDTELQGVPHVNAAVAQAIVDGRPYLVAMALDTVLQGAGLSAEQRTEAYGSLFVPINLNTASEAEMQLIPGVGGRMAHEFDEYRPWDGGMLRFRREIAKYVDDEEVARLEMYVFVPLDINTASSEDFKTIPGVGDRMAHEFDEYRPWVNMAQFEREIGKYVDDDEVARLARFMVFPQ